MLLVDFCSDMYSTISSNLLIQKYIFYGYMYSSAKLVFLFHFLFYFYFHKIIEFFLTLKYDIYTKKRVIKHKCAYETD